MLGLLSSLPRRGTHQPQITGLSLHDELSSNFHQESRTRKVSTQAKPHLHLEVGSVL